MKTFYTVTVEPKEGEKDVLIFNSKKAAVAHANEELLWEGTKSATVEEHLSDVPLLSALFPKIF